MKKEWIIGSRAVFRNVDIERIETNYNIGAEVFVAFAYLKGSLIPNLLCSCEYQEEFIIELNKILN
jgi:hypothetical protein